MNSLRRYSRAQAQRVRRGRPRQGIADRPGALLAAIEAVVGTAERKALHRAARAADVVAETQRGIAGIEERRRVRHPDTLIRHSQERIIELTGVIEVEDATADLVDLVVAEDMGVGDRDGRVFVGTLQGERRGQTRWIGERVESGELCEERRGTQPIVRRQPGHPPSPCIDPA